MKFNFVISIALGLLLLVVAYNASMVDFGELYSETKIKRWAGHLIEQESGGRNCSAVNYSDINRIYESMGRGAIKGTGIVDFPVRCWKEMRLTRMNYYVDYNVVAGVYRCEEDEMIQELQLAIYLEPRYVPQKNHCKVGVFPKAWNIPTGEATMFGLP